VFFRKASHRICSMASTPSFHSAGNCRRGYPGCQAVARTKTQAISKSEVTRRKPRQARRRVIQARADGPSQPTGTPALCCRCFHIGADVESNIVMAYTRTRPGEPHAHRLGPQGIPVARGSAGHVKVQVSDVCGRLKHFRLGIPYAVSEAPDRRTLHTRTRYLQRFHYGGVETSPHRQRT